MTISKYLPDPGSLKPNVLVLSRRKGYPYNNLLGRIKVQYSTLVDGSIEWIISSRHKNLDKLHTVNERYITKMDWFSISHDIQVGDEVFNPYSLDSHILEMMQIGACIRRGFYKKVLRLSPNTFLENGKRIEILPTVKGVAKVKCPTCHNFH